MSKNNKNKSNLSVKAKQKKKASSINKVAYQSNKVSNIENVNQFEHSNYTFQYIVRPNGQYTISRMYNNKSWNMFNIDIDYKKLRAWKENNKEITKKENNKFNNKYRDIEFNL